MMPGNLPSVSILVLNYNGKKFLDDCLTSLRELNYPRERFTVILVDNASTDGSVRYVKEKYPWVRILTLDRNYGFTGGNNRGVNVAHCEYIAFLNNDMKVDKDWLINLIQAAQEYGLCVYGSKILYFYDPSKIDFYYGKITIIGSGYSLYFGKKDFNQTTCEIVPYISGGAMLLRKDLFVRLGRFDEELFLMHDDVDLCWRAWLFGYKVLQVPTSIVYHKYGKTLGKRGSPLREFYGTRSSILNIIKNLEFTNVVIALTISFSYYLLRLCILARERDFYRGIRIIQGLLSSVKALPKAFRIRKFVRAKRKIKDRVLFKRGIISVFDKQALQLLKKTKLTF